MGQAVLHFLPKGEVAVYYYISLHFILPVLFGLIIYLPVRKGTTLVYGVLAIALPFMAFYFSLGHTFGLQYYFFCLLLFKMMFMEINKKIVAFYVIYSIALGVMISIVYPTLPTEDEAPEIQLQNL